MPENNEFVTKVGGEKQDAHLHEPILAGKHATADAVGRATVKRVDLTDEQTAVLYGRPS